MLNRSASILASIITILVCAVLIGQRLDAKWAGGIGHVDPCPAVLVDGDTTIKRGEVMSAGANDFAAYQFCNGMIIYLDKNTQVRLDGYPRPYGAYPLSLNLLEGRVITDGAFDIKARNLIVGAGPGCEIVHYSWLDELDVTPLVEAACTIVNPPITPPASQTTKYGTFDAVVVSTNTFEPTSSSAKSFYEWTGLKY